MKLSEKQRLFTLKIAELVIWAYENGYQFTKGDAYRDPRVHGAFKVKKSYSAPKSLHKLKLAQDLNLFIDDVYQDTTEAHRPIGEKWESMHPLCRWGGRFNDGNHYSMTHWGLK